MLPVNKFVHDDKEHVDTQLVLYAVVTISMTNDRYESLEYIHCDCRGPTFIASPYMDKGELL